MERPTRVLALIQIGLRCDALEKHASLLPGSIMFFNPSGFMRTKFCQQLCKYDFFLMSRISFSVLRLVLLFIVIFILVDLMCYTIFVGFERNKSSSDLTIPIQYCNLLNKIYFPLNLQLKL